MLLDGEQHGFVVCISGIVKNWEDGAVSEGQRNCFISPDLKKSKMDIEDLLMWFRFDSAWGGPFVMFYWISWSSSSNSGQEKNWPRVISSPSQSFLMVVLQRLGRFDSGCRTPPPLFSGSVPVWPPHRPFRKRNPTGFSPLVYAPWCTCLPTDRPYACECFSLSHHRCFLLLFRPSSDPLFSPSLFAAGIIMQNWTRYKNNPAFAMFFQGQMGYIYDVFYWIPDITMIK